MEKCATIREEKLAQFAIPQWKQDKNNNPENGEQPRKRKTQ